MSTNLPTLILGNAFSDERGSVLFCNEFDMERVRRMYLIAPSSTQIVRGWQAHQKEQKWFFCLSGAFEIKLVKVDNFNSPASELQALTFYLHCDQPQVLYMPGGYASGIKSTSAGSKLMVYSNFTVGESMQDDFRYTIDTWDVWKK
jgi:dTDP-4-dehydrorhamnose 3,5-epimerase-like enzyme